MKIFFFTSVLAGGGAERVMCQLANCFGKENDVTLIAAYKQEGEYLVNNTIRKVYIDKNINNKNTFLQIIRLRKMIREKKPEICVSFLPEPNFKMILASLGLKTKVIVSVRNDPNREYANLFKRLLAIILYPLASGIVFQTEDAKKWFSKRIQKKSTIIMNQVDQRFFKAKKISSDYWVATGRLNEQKNYPLMLNAFKMLIEKYPNEKLRIYGKGILKSKLSELIKSLGLQDNVSLMGQTSDVIDVLIHAKAFLLSSDYEGMPNGLLEALAVGLPCVVTDCPCGGPKEVVNSKINGILVPVNNEKKFFEMMLDLIENPFFAEQIAQNAKIMSKQFHPQEIYKKWDEYLKKIATK